MDLHNIAIFQMKLGELDEASESVQRAISLEQRFPDPHARAAFALTAAEIIMLQGRWDDGLRLNQEALALSRAVGSRVSEARALAALGQCLTASGLARDAEAALSTSVGLRREIADGSLRESLVSLAILKISLDKFSEALSLLEESLSVIGQSGAANRSAVKAQIALATIGQGNLSEGVDMIQKLLSDLRLLGDRGSLRELQRTSIAAVSLATRLGHTDAAPVMAPLIDEIRKARAQLS